MQLCQKDLFLLSQCAISAAFQAGQIITRYAQSKVTVNLKQSGLTLASQVVTEVDHLSQAIILQNLRPTCEQFDLALLTEESSYDRKRLEKDFFWCIDPLDGTLPFIESTPGYSVAIALVSREGIPYIGVVFDPVKQTLYHAVKGSGAFRNGTIWNLQSPKKTIQHPLTFVIDRSFTQHPHYTAVLAKIGAIAKELEYTELKIIKQGGAAMNACWVLEQAPACYFKFPKCEAGGGGLWDFAATACLFNEINAVASDINGQILDLNRTDSLFMNHRGVLYATDTYLEKRITQLYRELNSL
jgi:3'(2'), 5'-bisphosphate nucleotidase/myo-inositol-1(or 4)-monophosphatase